MVNKETDKLLAKYNLPKFDISSKNVHLFNKDTYRKIREIERYYNRAQTPKDNLVNEYFNGTLRREFLQLGNFTPDMQKFNTKLTEWLVEYNFRGPHQSLNYQTPIEFTTKHLKVLPMYSTYTFS